MKRSIAVLLTCLISALSAFGEPPTDEEIDSLYETRPDLVREMVRKLYVVERETPSISFPNLTITETESGVVRVEYDSPMEIEIGYDPYNLLYDIELSVTDVEYAALPEETPFPWRQVGIGTGAGVLVGLITGIILTN